MIRPDEFMRKHGFDTDDRKREGEKDHTLQENAREHAEHLRRPNAGTPHDWEDWERYQKEQAQIGKDEEE